MKEFMKLKAARWERILSHPFFDWLHSDAVPLEDKVLIAPIMTVFVMNFRDASRYFIRFPKPRNRFEEALNGGTREDETHSRLFLEDWSKMKLDERLGFRASDMLWWLFLSKENERFRYFVLEFGRLDVEDAGDPLVRFTHSEAGEAAGNAFFHHMAKVTSEIEAKTGLRYIYYGNHHLDREPGFVWGSKGVFDDEVLDEQQRPLAMRLSNRMFDLFEQVHDCFLDYGRTFMEPGVLPKRPRAEEITPRAASVPRERPSYEVELEQPMALYHEDVLRVIEERKAQAARHPFYAWLREETSVSPREKLMRLLPLWVPDIMGYRDLNRYAVRYPEPRTPKERRINEWCDDLETHSALFLNDWQALGMDEVLGWKAKDTLKFLFLDPQVETHRKNLATFAKLAMGHRDPAMLFWFVAALEASGHAFFENVKRLAEVVEKEHGIRLDYLCDRHDVAHGARGERLPRSAFITSERITTAERDVAIGMVDTIFDALEEHLTISLDAARSNKLGIPSERGAA
ncbi:hypothetical protein [Polyangium fumosum]|uniref:Uncharacterized protein n=1 Tax=Polyangium fumosum TaxID=889272 RepID=A0A4U1J9I8_9BACT|nr:hypothetical protein [Polyangium fumosum]TKD05028.1 hypothetical protein E8A74_22440 [Polyangium fumosum]